VPACKECNTKKKHMLPIEWEEYMEKIKKEVA
ncbi:MAG: HNH endonuclease, partial [Nitrospirae bacterium CG_4_10_14_3_um_filter_44_29]